MKCLMHVLVWAVLTVPVASAVVTPTEPDFEHFGDEVSFEDKPVPTIKHPEWFKTSFLDLRDDLDDAREDGKKGIIVYFGQDHCTYCKALMDVNFGQPDITRYTRSNFDVIAIDIWGSKEVTDLNGISLSEREFSVREGTNFTPSLVFYDLNGQEALRLRGYYPPYKFRAALEYVAGEHYLFDSYRQYLSRADGVEIMDEGGLSEEPFILRGPRVLDRSEVYGERPLVVFFEQGNCHSCDLLHSSILGRQSIPEMFKRFDVEQLNMWSDTPVITPSGQKTTAREWADQLGVFYGPTLVFFDHWGHEIMRLDSVVMFYRLRSVLEYVLTEDYFWEPNFQRWRHTKAVEDPNAIR
ncbi:MAG: thioredoxin family protein [Gammaproteobacteria bacterium]